MDRTPTGRQQEVRFNVDTQSIYTIHTHTYLIIDCEVTLNYIHNKYDFIDRYVHILQNYYNVEDV